MKILRKFLSISHSLFLSFSLLYSSITFSAPITSKNKITKIDMKLIVSHEFINEFVSNKNRKKIIPLLDPFLAKKGFGSQDIKKIQNIFKNAKIRSITNKYKHIAYEIIVDEKRSIMEILSLNNDMITIQLNNIKHTFNYTSTSFLDFYTHFNNIAAMALSSHPLNLFITDAYAFAVISSLVALCILTAGTLMTFKTHQYDKWLAKTYLGGYCCCQIVNDAKKLKKDTNQCISDLIVAFNKATGLKTVKNLETVKNRFKWLDEDQNLAKLINSISSKIIDHEKKEILTTCTKQKSFFKTHKITNDPNCVTSFLNYQKENNTHDESIYKSCMQMIQNLHLKNRANFSTFIDKIRPDYNKIITQHNKNENENENETSSK